MIILALMVLLGCNQSQQNLTFDLLSTTGNVKAFSVSSTSTFKGLPKLPILNETAGETRSVYYYDQLVAILDIAEGKKLLHCELIEIYESSEKYEIFKNLSTSKAHRISFNDILKLMDKCDKLDENVVRSLNFNAYVEKYNEGNPLFDGIVPGTKWCGTGDIAKSYHDLGSRARVDRCCRAHDLCPIKIRAYKSRYNLMNNSFFSKSHCSCDKAFYDCLKNINHISARVIGNIYFNIAQPVCIEDVFSSKNKYLRRFVPVKTRF